MKNLLTPEQQDQRTQFKTFADDVVAPLAATVDSAQSMPREIIAKLGAAGYLASMVPRGPGKPVLGAMAYGFLNEELGRTCQSVRNLVACADMVAHSIYRWGSAAHRDEWLGRIASGDAVAAFGLTEPRVGSDAKSVQTTANRVGSEIILQGRKRWISFGQNADVFIVFAKYEGSHTAFLVDRHSVGLSVQPISDLFGLRGSMLGEVVLDGCRVPVDGLLGRPGTGLSFVASSALDVGRYSTAWGAVGLAQACLDASCRYADERVQFDVPIKGHQLVQRMLANMATDTVAARMLCYRAGVSREAGDPDAVNQTLMAKYFSSTVVGRIANDAVQIHGAQGISSQAPVQRHLRDAKVLEIIEGTTQIHQSILGQYAVVAGRS
ncbi:acyl-CoA dehydrogenase family protein [Plantactinospora sp. ZYX-F-223]|uniref:acyl-CoA dehydrogenase family protein n=1 Tax=Plantactinospora sp. ZYX-F-223 TaxID=3144103 RepID=UPI0031FCCC74